MATDDFDWRKIITIDPGVRFGKPCVRHTRISVYDVLGWLAAGMTFEEIYDDFPDLTHEDIRAACAYAGDELAEKRGHSDEVFHRQQPVAGPSSTPA